MSTTPRIFYTTYTASVQNNDTDWLHRTFADAFEQHQRLQDVDGVQREHSLYGPQATRLSWIYPPSHLFLVKPQALLMPEVFVNDDNIGDTSFSSTEAVDGDTSFDSMGGHVVSQWRDVFLKRNRREVDLIVAKKLQDGLQIPLTVVELKRDDLSREEAMQQIEDYLNRIVVRCKALGHNIPIYGLLILGAYSIRIVSTWDPREAEVIHTYQDTVEGRIRYVKTDSKVVNEWLLGQAVAWSGY